MEVFATITAVMVLITTILYAYQAVYIVIPLILGWRKKKHAPIRQNRYGILIPARNEQTVLPYLLDSIAAQDYPKELIQIFVIADNCTDATAQIARDRGAIVVERFNKTQVGKGYALNYLLQSIKDQGYMDTVDVFMVFDADNLLEPDYLTQINQTFSDGYQAACGYRNTKNIGSNWISAGYGVWYLHDSSHLNQSRSLLNISAAVSGTGFGFTRQLMETTGGWQFFTLTEDLEFNAWCISHGVKIGYCHKAMLYDEQPITFPVSWKQRVRWVQGGYQLIRRHTGSLLRGLFKGRWQSYSCLETLTLTPYGAWLALLAGLLTCTEMILSLPLVGLLQAAVAAVVGSYVAMSVMGLVTVAMEWKKMRVSKPKRIWAAFMFPFFLLTFMVIAIVAPFKKFQWVPIAHTVAVGNDVLEKHK